MAGIDHLREFGHYLSTKCGLQLGKSLFFDAMPTETSQAGGPAVFVFEQAGAAPALTMSTALIRSLRFAIDVRSTKPGSTQSDYPDPTNARNLAQTVWAACAQLSGNLSSTGASPSTGNWLYAIPQHDVYMAGRDNSNRIHFSFTVDAERQGP